MYTAFLAVAIKCGTPAMLAAVALGQLSNLMGCLTTYGIGSAPPYFGAGYVPQVSQAHAGSSRSMSYGTTQDLVSCRCRESTHRSKQAALLQADAPTSAGGPTCPADEPCISLRTHLALAAIPGLCSD
jgi:hypothetical protein